MCKIPSTHPVKNLIKGSAAYRNAKCLATCGTCGRSWDDAVVTSMTPAPSARCPFEYYHKEYKSQAAKDAQESGYGDADYWDYLDESAQEKSDRFVKKGDNKTAREMLSRSLGDALAGSEGE